jgi:bacteriorhodopsin
MRNKKILFMFLAFFTALTVAAQEQVEMADEMRSSGKIYVVIAVILTILAGLIFYVWRLDRKITRLENDQKG